MALAWLDCAYCYLLFFLSLAIDCTCVGRRGVQPSYEPDQSDADLPALSAECSHEHCHLGCVCDSLCTPQKRKLRSGHCGRPECMFDCRCDAASLLQSPGGGSGGNVEKEPAGPLSFTRNLFRPAEPKESGGESAAPSLNSSVRPTVKRRKRRGWGIPIDEGLNVADDATARTDKDGHLLRKSGRIKERRRFSDIEKMKSLIYFDASLWLREDKGPQRRRRVMEAFGLEFFCIHISFSDGFNSAITSCINCDECGILKEVCDILLAVCTINL